MGKTARQDSTDATDAIERHTAPSLVMALVGSLLFVGLSGYLAMQLKLSEIHLFLGFDTRFAAVPGDWPQYMWRLGLVLLALAAVLAYRFLVRDAPARFMTLVVLAAAAAIGSPITFGSPQTVQEQHPLLVYVVVEGAKSPFLLAFIGAVLADVMTDSWRARAHESARPSGRRSSGTRSR